MSNRLEMLGIYEKRVFNPNNKDDVKIVKEFLNKNHATIQGT